MPNEDACRLYLITPPKIDLDPFVAAFEAALDGGDVACLQIRLKQAPDQDIVAAARRLKPICDAHAVALLINDRPDLAAASGADGAHVGQQDMSYAEARRLLGDAAIIGVTCHDSRDLAIAAANASSRRASWAWSASIILPSSTVTPLPSACAASKASINRRAFSISPSLGEKTRFAVSI